MKAVLVIDIPNDLSLSDLSLYGGLWETGEEDGWAYEFRTEDIKPLPNAITERGKWISEEYQKGWNAFRETLE